MLNDDAIRAIGQYTGILYGPKSYTNFALTCKRMKTLLLLPEDADNKVNNQTNIIYNIINFFIIYNTINLFFPIII